MSKKPPLNRLLVHLREPEAFEALAEILETIGRTEEARMTRELGSVVAGHEAELRSLQERGEREEEHRGEELRRLLRETIPELLELEEHALGILRSYLGAEPEWEDGRIVNLRARDGLGETYRSFLEQTFDRLEWQAAVEARDKAQRARECRRAVEATGGEPPRNVHEELARLRKLDCYAQEIDEFRSRERGGKGRARQYDPRNQAIQDEARRVWKANPRLSKIAVATAIQKRQERLLELRKRQQRSLELQRRKGLNPEERAELRLLSRPEELAELERLGPLLLSDQVEPMKVDRLRRLVK
ncbi:MAG TPA: hypothetical protein VMT85_07200 [Thermoanaerobaculia bacterium]|nr:hypothetical protein [Thermoanaerobaculia bacterium]